MSVRPAISYKDEKFQSQHAAKCDLLIAVSGDTFSYAVVDQIQDQLKCLYSVVLTENLEEALSAVVEADPVFNFNYRKVKVSVETSEFTFIPTAAYSEELLPAYHKFNVLQGGSTPIVTHLKNAGISNVATVNRQVQDILSKKYTACVHFSQADPLIESALKAYYKPIKRQVFIQFTNLAFELLVTEGKKVIFYNLFPKSTVDEFNYFLLFAAAQLRLETRELPVILSGNIIEGGECYQRIQKYFTDISFADSSKLIRIPHEADGLDLHQFFSLLGLNLCA